MWDPTGSEHPPDTCYPHSLGSWKSKAQAQQVKPSCVQEPLSPHPHSPQWCLSLGRERLSRVCVDSYPISLPWIHFIQSGGKSSVYFIVRIGPDKN